MALGGQQRIGMMVPVSRIGQQGKMGMTVLESVAAVSKIGQQPITVGRQQGPPSMIGPQQKVDGLSSGQTTAIEVELVGAGAVLAAAAVMPLGMAAPIRSMPANRVMKRSTLRATDGGITDVMSFPPRTLV